MSFYYYSVCHVCKKADANLKKCSKCKVLHYCSREHQVRDWPSHKEICKAISRCNKFLVFPPGLDAAEFNRFKLTTALLWHFELCRELKTFEHEMWMFPKVCVVCFSSEVSTVCRNCFSVAYCSEEHEQAHKAKHEEFCPKLKLSLEIQQKLFARDTIRDCTHFDFSRDTDTFPASMREVVKIINFKQNDFVKNEMDMVMLSDLFVTAVNITYALEKSKYIDKRRSKKNKLVLHIVAPEMISNTNWLMLTEFLSHWIINLKMVKIFLVYPETDGERYAFTMNCTDCSKKKFSGMVFSVDDEYYNCVGSLSRPDLVVLFDSNLRMFGGTDDWKENILKMIWHRGTPVILTAHSRAELDANLEKFPAAQIKFYVEPQLNKYASLRPLRSGSEGEDPIFYQNQYIAVLAKK